MREPIDVCRRWPIDFISVFQKAPMRVEIELLSEGDHYCSVAVMTDAITHAQAFSTKS